MTKQASVLLLLLSLFSTVCYAQSNRYAKEEVPSNKELYKPSDPNIIYSYNDSRQTLSYSGNWDFDGDGKKDSLLFIGNGGAHLYYHLRIILSTDHKIRDYPDLNLDMPYLGRVEDLERAGKEWPLLPQLVVHDFDGDGFDDVYLNYDIHWSLISKEWQKHGVIDRHILLKYKNKDIVITNFKQG